MSAKNEAVIFKPFSTLFKNSVQCLSETCVCGFGAIYLTVIQVNLQHVAALLRYQFLIRIPQETQFYWFNECFRAGLTSVTRFVKAIQKIEKHELMKFTVHL